jgi:hypothetical protein
MTLSIVPTFFAISIIWALYFKLSQDFAHLPSAFLVASYFGQYVCSTLAFAALYKIINGPALSYRSAFFGALWAAVAFEVVKTTIVSTAAWDMNFSSPVGTILAYSIVTCIACVFVSGALIFGNHIAYVDQLRFILEEMEVPHQRAELRPMREIALAALLEMTRRFYIKGGADDPTLGLDPVDLARIAKTTPQRGKHIIRLLERVGLVKIIQDGHRETSILKIHPENLSLDDFLGRIEQRVHAKSLNVPSPLTDPSNTWFWQEYERALKDRFGSLSLKDLAELSLIMKKKDSA